MFIGLVKLWRLLPPTHFTVVLHILHYIKVHYFTTYISPLDPPSYFKAYIVLLILTLRLSIEFQLIYQQTSLVILTGTRYGCLTLSFVITISFMSKPNILRSTAIFFGIIYFKVLYNQLHFVFSRISLAASSPKSIHQVNFVTYISINVPTSSPNNYPPSRYCDLSQFLIIHLSLRQLLDLYYSSPTPPSITQPHLWAHALIIVFVVLPLLDLKMHVCLQP